MTFMHSTKGYSRHVKLEHRPSRIMYRAGGQGCSQQACRQGVYAALLVNWEVPSMCAVSSRCSTAAAACARLALAACTLPALQPLAVVAAHAGCGKYLARTASMHAVRYACQSSSCACQHQ